MPGAGRAHDRAILDALESFGGEAFDGAVWRVSRRAAEPLRGTSSRGRWSPSGEFEVLYTSLEKDCALAEIGYRLSLEPVWPSHLLHDLHNIAIRCARILNLSELPRLASLGVDVAQYRSFDYSATQALAAAAHFLEFEGLLAPSARYEGVNLMLFLDRIAPVTRLEILATEPVDWDGWRRG